MTFHEFGDDTRPHIMLIHGGGNAWWNYLRQARVLAQHYHVILPTLDGHVRHIKRPMSPPSGPQTSSWTISSGIAADTSSPCAEFPWADRS